MWRYSIDDQPLKRERVEPGKGIVGCEMHEDFGWGERYHSWDLNYTSHRCPDCHFVCESRIGYEQTMEGLSKEVTCERCGRHFVVTRKRRPHIGPVLGDETRPQQES